MFFNFLFFLRIFKNIETIPRMKIDFNISREKLKSDNQWMN